MLGSPERGTRVDKVMEGAASSSMPPARSCESISGSPPSWLLGKTVTVIRPFVRWPISLAASVRRTVSGCVSGVLTPSLNSNSAAAAGPPRIVAAQANEAAPSKRLRVIFLDFIAISLPGGVKRRGFSQGDSFSRTRLAPQDRRRNTAHRCMKPFWGTDETERKQSGRKSIETPGGYLMNHSIHSADRATHLKIVVLALVAGISVAGFGLAARSNVDYSQSAHVLKAGKPVVVTNSA